MDAAHVAFRGDIAFANAQTPRLFLGMIAAGGMENISLVVHKQRPRIESALPTARALRVWLMWSWAQRPFCRTLWKSMTIGWTLSFIRILRALLSLPLVTSLVQGLLMVDASVALRGGIKRVTAPIGGTCPKTSAVAGLESI
jgi:hypothetical protein